MPSSEYPVGAERTFDVIGIDVLAVGSDDHFFAASDDGELPALVEATEVSGVKPSVGVEHARGGFGIIRVAGHHVGAAREDFTDALTIGLLILSSTPGSALPTLPACTPGPGFCTVKTGAASVSP